MDGAFTHIFDGFYCRASYIFAAKKGIPLRSSLSPFFGALYLFALDKAFEHQRGVFYLRYMDDWVILTKTKRQYQRAKKKMFEVLKALKLKISPTKRRWAN
jgi:hypothetical protein